MLLMFYFRRALPFVPSCAVARGYHSASLHASAIAFSRHADAAS